jgi:hypothetical protein
VFGVLIARLCRVARLTLQVVPLHGLPRISPRRFWPLPPLQGLFGAPGLLLNAAANQVEGWNASATPSLSSTQTRSASTSPSATASQSQSASLLLSVTQSRSPSGTQVPSPTPSQSGSQQPTPSSSGSPSQSGSGSPSQTGSLTQSGTQSQSSTQSQSGTQSQSVSIGGRRRLDATLPGDVIVGGSPDGEAPSWASPAAVAATEAIAHAVHEQVRCRASRSLFPTSLPSPPSTLSYHSIPWLQLASDLRALSGGGVYDLRPEDAEGGPSVLSAIANTPPYERLPRLADSIFGGDGSSRGPRERRLQSSSSGSAPPLSTLPSPVTCVTLGATVLWQLPEGRGAYPVYQKDSFLNSNPGFDYGAFRALASYAANAAANISLFAFTFTQPGTFVFASSANPNDVFIVVVRGAGQACPATGDGTSFSPPSAQNLVQVRWMRRCYPSWRSHCPPCPVSAFDHAFTHPLSPASSCFCSPVLCSARRV